MRALNRIAVLLITLSLFAIANATPQSNTRAGADDTRAENSSASRVNINTAGADELASLPGIGPALAKRIIDYRTQNGPFKRIDDLIAVKGLGSKMLDKIRQRLSVETNAR